MNLANKIAPMPTLVYLVYLIVSSSNIKKVLIKTDEELSTYLFPFHLERIWLFCHWPYFIHNSKLPIGTALRARNQPRPVWINNRHYHKRPWSTSRYRYSGCSSWNIECFMFIPRKRCYHINCLQEMNGHKMRINIKHKNIYIHNTVQAIKVSWLCHLWAD